MGAQRVVEWATERVMAPHAEHQDPADHPECVVCRTMVVLGEPGVAPVEPEQEQPDPGGDVHAPAGRASGEIEWIPIREAGVQSASAPLGRGSEDGRDSTQ